MTRIFDHLDSAPRAEDRHFSRVARRMRSSAWWRSVPRYEQPAPVAGETCGRRLLRILAPHFVAGVEIGGPVAPIVQYMRGWSERQIRAHCERKKWTCEVVS